MLITGTPPAEQVTYDIAGIYFRLAWGSGNMRETAYVSYPFGGGSFQVHAASVRVEFPSGFTPAAVLNQGIPSVGGFISEGHRSEQHRKPTLVVNPRILATPDAILSRTFFAPPRAVGYRLYTPEDPDLFAACRFVVDQAFWGAGSVGVLARDGDNVTPYRGNSNELDISSDGTNASQRATKNANDWTVLMPQAIGVIVQPFFDSDAPLSIQVGVEWILDLG
jgi:hypothetical protein